MTFTLAVTERDTSKKPDTLRAEGNVPAVVYGPKQEPIAIAVSDKELAKLIEEAGESTIISLTGLKEDLEVLIKDVDFDPVKRGVRHADFYAIERGKEMTVDVALEFIGIAPVEKNGIGTVTKVLHEVEVTCMPRNLPSEIEVDISGLATEDDQIHISDLKLPEGVKVENDPTEAVAVVSVAKEESEEDSAPVDMDAIKVEEKGKAEEDEQS